MTDEEIANLAADLHCGTKFIRDILVWAGGNEALVREASENCDSAERMKAFIIDRRVAKLESKLS